MEKTCPFILLAILTSITMTGCLGNTTKSSNDKLEQMNHYVDTDSVKYKIIKEDSADFSVSDRLKAFKELLEKDM